MNPAREEVVSQIEWIKQKITVHDQPGGNAQILRNLQAELDVWSQKLDQLDRRNCIK